MQYFDNGSLFTVTVTTREVEEFRSSWPCSGLRSAPVTFQFHKRGGDLIDSNDAQKHPYAEASAISALMDDAKAYGFKRMAKANKKKKNDDIWGDVPTPEKGYILD